MKKISRRMKRLLAILIVETIIAINVIGTYAEETSDGNVQTYTMEEVNQMANDGNPTDVNSTEENVKEEEKSTPVNEMENATPAGQANENIEAKVPGENPDANNNLVNQSLDGQGIGEQGKTDDTQLGTEATPTSTPTPTPTPTATPEDETTQENGVVEVVVNEGTGISGCSVKLPELEKNAKLVISESSESDGAFRDAYQGEDSVKGVLVFDLALEDEDGNKISLNGDASVTLDVSADAFADAEDIHKYLLMHKGESGIESLGEFDSLSGISFQTSSFSPFAIVALSEKSDGNDEKTGKVYDISDWISDVAMYVKVNGNYQKVTDDTILKNNDYIKVDMEFEVPEEIDINSKDKLEYEIPDFVYKLTEVEKGRITQKGGSTTIGDYTIYPSESGNGGKMVLQYDADYFKNGGTICFGGASFEGALDVKEITEETVVKKYFGNFPFSVRVREEVEEKTGTLTIEKKNNLDDIKDGKVAYTVTIKAPAKNTMDMEDVVFEDIFTNGNNLVEKVYDVKVEKQGDIVTDEAEPGIGEDNKTITWKIGTMKPGSQIKILYIADINTAGASNANIVNKAAVSAKDLEKITAESTIKGENSVSIRKSVVKQDGLEYNYTDHTVKYKVEVTNNSKLFPVTLDKVVDRFVGDNGSEKFVIGYRDFSTDGLTESITPTVDLDSKKLVWKKVTIPAGKTVTFQYTVEVKDLSSGNNSSAEEDIWWRLGKNNGPGTVYNLHNIAEAYLNNQRVAFANNGVSFHKQWIWKGYGRMLENGNVEFEIHVNEGDHGKSETFHNIAGWNITDKLADPANWEIVKESIKVFGFNEYHANSYGNTPNGAIDGYLTMNSDGFTYKVPDEIGSKYIIIRYEVKHKTPLPAGSTVTCRNGASLGGSENIVWADATVNVNGSSALSKTILDWNTKEMLWKSTISSNVEAGTVYEDFLNGKHTFGDYSKLELHVTGADGAEIPEGDGTWKFEPLENGQKFRITFRKAIPASAEKPIVITYKTNPTQFSGAIWVKNNAKLIIGDSVQTAEKSHVYTVTETRDIRKYGGGCDAAKGTQKWYIELNSVGTMSGSAEIMEVLPEGTEFVSAEISVLGGAYRKNEVTLVIEPQGNGNVKLTVHGLKADEVRGGQGICKVKICVVTRFNDQKMEEYRLGNKMTITNKAILLGEGENLETSATQVMSRKVLGKLGEYKDGVATYSIIVNEDAVDLLPDADTITLVDEMDDVLVLYTDSVKVTDESGNPVDYTANLIAPNKFEVTIPDNQKLIISYSAYAKGQVGTVYTDVKNTVSYVGYETIPGETKIISNLKVQKSSAFSGGYNVILKKFGDGGEALAGVQFQTYFYKNNKLVKGSIITTDAKGEAVFKVSQSDVSKSGILYAYQEIKAPEGYILDKEIHEIYVVPNKELTDITAPEGAEVYPIGSQIPVYNKKIAFVVRKTDESGNPLGGAVFTLTGEDGVTVENKGSNSGEFRFTDLVAGKSYTLKEKSAPQGYVCTDKEYQIRIYEDGNMTYAVDGETERMALDAGLQIPGLVIENRQLPGAMELRKVDQDGEAVEGVVFAIYADVDCKEKIDSFVTDAEGIATIEVDAGTYYVKELSAPKGYVVSDAVYEVVVKVGETAQVNNGVAIVNHRQQKEVYFSKQDVNGKELPGAELEILNAKTQKAVDSWVSTEEPHVVKLNFNTTYIFREIKAPQGYKLAAPITFTIDEEGKIDGGDTLVMVDEAENVPTPTPTPTPNEPTPTPTPDGPTPTPTPEVPVPTPTPGTPTPTGPVITPPDDNQVLGASRVREGGAVLGARRGMDYAVLGKRRRPSTGDSMAMLLWMIALGGSAVIAGTSMVILRGTSKKKHK